MEHTPKNRSPYALKPGYAALVVQEQLQLLASFCRQTLSVKDASVDTMVGELVVTCYFGGHVNSQYATRVYHWLSNKVTDEDDDAGLW